MVLDMESAFHTIRLAQNIYKVRGYCPVDCLADTHSTEIHILVVNLMDKSMKKACELYGKASTELLNR